MKYTNRTEHEQEVITKAYNFEIKGIENLDTSRNPWFDEIMKWTDGKEIWEGINVAVEMRFKKTLAIDI